MVKFYEIFQDELMSIFFKLFQKIEEEGTLLNLFYEAMITLVQLPVTLVLKPDEDTKRNKDYP